MYSLLCEGNRGFTSSKSPINYQSPRCEIASRDFLCNMDWLHRLDYAKKHGISQKEEDMAADWRTCAVGEKLKITPESHKSDSVVADWLYTKHKYLYNLGVCFHQEIRGGDIDEAERTLDMICNHSEADGIIVPSLEGMVEEIDTHIE